MKILHVNAGNENGGGRTIIVNLIKGMIDQDINAQLLVFEKGPVSDWSQKMGIPTTIMHQNSKLDMSIALRLQKFIIDNHIDIVNTHGPRANFIMYLIHKFVKAKWVVTVHSDPNIDFSDSITGNLLLSMNIHAIKAADKLILVSGKLTKPLIRFGIDKAKMVPMFNAMTFSQTSPKPHREKIFTILDVGRLVVVKNQQLLIRALARVTFDFKLILVGNGPTGHDLGKLTNSLKLNDKVVFEGFKDDTSVFYKNSDLFTLVSSSDTFPMTIMEAANYGIPTIATNVGSVSKLITPKSGWLVESNNIEQLISILNVAYEKWLSNDLSKMGQAAYQYCSTNFSSERLAKAYLEVYKEIKN